jgi:uncharacterized membrane protein (DUF4010 family)
MEKIPVELINFVLVTLVALIIGLAQRRLHPSDEEFKPFGTDRTFTFIGILGYILYIIDPKSPALFLGGGVVISLLLSINYYFKIKSLKLYGITTIIIAFITYCLAPLVITQPKWMFLLVVVTVLIFTELKESFLAISQKFNRDEFLTLGKFLVIAGVVLPIVPDTPIFPDLSISAYKVWLAVVVISSISYLSYLLKKFVFIDSGIIISGILGGLYSSTATTVILARKSKLSKISSNQYASSIILATAMMYLRIMLLLLIFNIELFNLLWVSFLILFVVSVMTAVFILKFHNNSKSNTDEKVVYDKNPLEFKFAIIFTVLYVAFTFITYYSILEFGIKGLNVLSYFVGVTDIDPFLINLFQGKYQVGTVALAIACLQAIISNNVVKALYAVVLGKKTIAKPLTIGFGIIILVNILITFLIY